jgi:hypothetical protein
LLFARLMGEKFAGTSLEKLFISPTTVREDVSQPA